jgi:hypothetical protein
MPNGHKHEGGKTRWLRRYRGDITHALNCCLAGRLPREHASYLEGVLANGHMPKPAELGAVLRLTFEQREANRIFTIPPIDKTKAELEALKREAKRKREQRRRQRNGAMSRAAYMAAVKSKQPWVALGMSRRTYYRHKAKGDTR